VPSGPILNVKETFENEQVQHLGLAVPVKHHALASCASSGRRDVLAHAALGAHSLADIGQHTDEILGELGFSADDIKGCARTRWSSGHGRALFTR